MKQGDISRLLLMGFGLVLLHETPTHSSCAPMENQNSYPYSPSLAIRTSQFPTEDALSTGYNYTISCISNISKAYFGNPYYGRPYWIQIFFNNAYIRSCGGGDADSEDSKICTYSIRNSTVSDSGNYTCVTRNQLYCTKGTITINFEKSTPPNFTLNPPHGMDVSTGSTVNLTCEATGIPRPIVTWYKDGRPISSSNNIREVQGLSQLSLESVTSHDQGEYWCEAQNSEGWSRSSRTDLNVLSRPTILVHPRNVSAYLEERFVKVVFFCEASGFPRPIIRWLKNNSTLTGGIVIQNGSSSSLELLHLAKREENLARYKCVAKNPLGEVSSKEGVLVIRGQTHHSDAAEGERPFYLDPKSIKASGGDNVVFVCAVEGNPVPHIVWLKDGAVNKNGNADYYQGNQSATSVLNIYSVKGRHAGRYSCEATNSKGNVISRVAILSIKDDRLSSLCISKAVWIPVATGAVILLVAIISIVFVHNKSKQANFSIKKKMKEEKEIPRLSTHKDTKSQLKEDNTAPRYQMTNMAVEIQ